MDTTSAPRFSQKVVSELLLGGLLESLASCPGVAQVRLFTRAPASALAISSWEGSTATLLPQDLKAFYLVTDGVSALEI